MSNSRTAGSAEIETLSFGALGPGPFDRVVIALTSGLPDNWLGLRLAILLRRLVTMRLPYPDGAWTSFAGGCGFVFILATTDVRRTSYSRRRCTNPRNALSSPLKSIGPRRTILLRLCRYRRQCRSVLILRRGPCGSKRPHSCGRTGAGKSVAFVVQYPDQSGRAYTRGVHCLGGQSRQGGTGR